MGLKNSVQNGIDCFCEKWKFCENKSDFESFSCGNEILASDFYGDYKMFEGRKAKGAWGEDEGGEEAIQRLKRRKGKKREDLRGGFFFIFYFF